MGRERQALLLAAPQSGQGLAGATLIKQVPYVPTPQDIVEKMLDLAKVTSDDVVYDLGSGDGRIVITAAQKYGAHAVGVEINPDLYSESSKRIKELGLDDRAHIIYEDMFDVSVHRATVVMLYLLTSFNEKLRPKLETRAPARNANCLSRFSHSRDGIPTRSLTWFPRTGFPTSSTSTCGRNRISRSSPSRPAPLA